VQVRHGLGWRKVPNCNLELAPQDASFAVKVVQKHRSFCTDLDLNLWEVDLRMPSRLGYYDLLGDFSTTRNFGVLGKLWVELKTMSAANFEKQLGDQKELLEAKLGEVHQANPSGEAVLLLATKAQRDGRGWRAPTLVAELLLVGASGWQNLTRGPPAKTPRGKANPHTKPALQEVWTKLKNKRVKHPETGRKLYRLNDFLDLLGLPTKSLGKRSKTFNTFLSKEGCADRVEQVKLPNLGGSEPWLASKDAVRCLYKQL